MTEWQERRYLALCELARDFWEKRFAAFEGEDVPREVGADVECKLWWARFGEGLPLPHWLEREHVAGGVNDA